MKTKRFRIVDLETPLETFFTGLGVAGAATFVSAFIMARGKHPALSWDHAQLGMLAGMAVAALGYFLRWVTDEHYQLDLGQRRLHFKSRVGPIWRQRLVAHLDDVVALGISGTFHDDKAGRRWTYQVYAVLPKKLVRLSDDMPYQQALTSVKEMGKATQIPVHPPVPERQLTLKSGEPGYRDPRAGNSDSVLLAALGVCGFAIIAGVYFSLS